MGQLGTLLSSGLLKQGHPVVPVLRDDDLAKACTEHEPAAIIVATGEDDLDPALAAIPDEHRGSVVLIQNELRPDQWVRRSIEPTVAVIWFEKKRGKLAHEVLPSVLWGPSAPLLSAALDRQGLHSREVHDPDDLIHQLALKNLYILALNFAGLKQPGVASDLVESRKDELEPLASEVLQVERGLLETAAPYSKIQLDQQRLLAELKQAIEADRNHGLAGRSAPRRLQRTLAHAARLGLALPHLEGLAKENR